jgi:hypothetical protein
LRSCLVPGKTGSRLLSLIAYRIELVRDPNSRLRLVSGRIDTMDCNSNPVHRLFGRIVVFCPPCVLPLVPAYIGYLGGTAVMADGQGETSRERGRTFFHALFFVLGFSAVFVLLGASATLIGRVLFDYSGLLQRAGGVLLVVFGMRLAGHDWSRRRWFVAAAVVAIVALLFNSGVLAGGLPGLGQDSIVWLEECDLGPSRPAGAGRSTARQAILARAAGI